MKPTGVTTMTDRPPRRILHRLGTTLVVAGMATGSLGQRGHQATGDFMLDRSVTIVVSSDEPEPVRLAAEDLAGDFEKVLGARPNIVTRVEDAGQQAIVVGELGNLSPGDAAQGIECARIVFDRRCRCFGQQTHRCVVRG